MTDYKTTFETLDQLLRKDEANLNRLAEVLEQEHRALASNAMEQLEQATSEKNELLDALRDRAKQKIRLLAQIGYHPDSGQAVSDFLRDQAGADSALMERWEAAQKQLSECQHRNAVNGRILSHLQRRLSRVSDIIRGADQQQALYGSTGESRNLTHSQVFASA
ncbi:flagellar protein FlgN [Salicola sp. Rm-C-2C1-2]|uniref:flagella synthesis protein FlgN n=1 Tax=Salicola sp. Rm-C-2C1-2 TaxID=3141321 RepID=UPI0032E3C6AB